MGFATDSATGAVSYRDQNAEYTFEIADKNIVKLIKDEDGDDAFCSVSIGKTTVEVYEQFPGQEKKHLGTLNVNVTKATMADVCEDAFSKETENTIKLKANFGQDRMISEAVLNLFLTEVKVTDWISAITSTRLPMNPSTIEFP